MLIFLFFFSFHKLVSSFKLDSSFKLVHSFICLFVPTWLSPCLLSLVAVFKAMSKGVGGGGIFEHVGTYNYKFLLYIVLNNI